MAPLPDNLEELSLIRCERLKQLDHIPPKLKSLKVSEMGLLQILSFNLPQTLEHLKISKSPNIESGFEKYLIEMGSHTGSPFPPNLRVLKLCEFKSTKIYKCYHINFIGSDDIPLEGIRNHGKMPTSLKTIDLDDLENLIWIDKLPSNLETLSIYNCNSSRLKISSFPRHLIDLAIRN
jgi:hypothetical protein